MKIFIAAATILYLKIITSYVTVTLSTPATNVTICGNLTCFNNAKCDNRSNGDMYCMCQRGYKGSTCDEDLDECKFGDPCFRRGKCQNYIGGYRCACFKGWLGEDVHCVIKDNTTTVHECDKGWFGEWCLDQCLNDSMCRSHEVCVMHNTGVISESGHLCRCAPGWHGRDCLIDQNECLTNTCPKTAKCMNNPGSFSCPCLPGWKGMKCDIDEDECLAYPCQHSSNCTNTKGSYICTCAEGWKGVNCDEDIDECAMNPCNSSSNCENVPGSFNCTVFTVQEQKKSDGDNVYIIIGAVIGSLFLIGCLVIGVYVIKRGSHKRNASVDSQLGDEVQNYHSNSKNSNQEQ